MKSQMMRNSLNKGFDFDFSLGYLCADGIQSNDGGAK